MTEQEKTEVRLLKKRLAEIEAFRIEEDKGIRPKNYRGPLPRPECNCPKTYHCCWGCCNTNQEIRSNQGIYG